MPSRRNCNADSEWDQRLGQKSPFWRVHVPMKFLFKAVSYWTVISSLPAYLQKTGFKGWGRFMNSFKRVAMCAALGLALTVSAGCSGNIALIGRPALQLDQEEIFAEIEWVDTSSRQMHLRPENSGSRVVGYSADARVLYQGREYLDRPIGKGRQGLHATEAGLSGRLLYKFDPGPGKRSGSESESERYFESRERNTDRRWKGGAGRLPAQFLRNAR